MIFLMGIGWRIMIIFLCINLVLVLLSTNHSIVFLIEGLIMVMKDIDGNLGIVTFPGMQQVIYNYIIVFQLGNGRTKGGSA